MISCIYTITNQKTNQVYVGKTLHFIRRMGCHKLALRKNKHYNPPLQNSWNKYGEDNFKFEILVECEKEFLFSEEHYWCNLLNVHNQEYGFNIAITNPINQITCSEMTKEKIRKKAIGRTWSKEYKELFSKQKIGVKQSIECVKFRTEKISKCVFQYTLSGEYLQEWKSANEIFRKLDIPASNICNCCKGNLKTAGKFRWSHTRSNNLDKLIRKPKVSKKYSNYK